MQQNLKLERDLQVSLNQHLEGELSNAHHQQLKASDLERQMNELKLKMLIKFDKIKLLEDFYNVSTPFSHPLEIQPGPTGLPGDRGHRPGDAPDGTQDS